MESDFITIRGAREHNLKDVDLDLPRYKLIVITGLSGSGKSSLAFDTIYAEGQRRYVESLSAYARQFLGSMERPDVDHIEGLSPAISIEQKTVSRSPRSTVGTVTEIYDYLRLLFARAGVQHCPKDGTPVQRQSLDLMVDRILDLDDGIRVIIMAPVVRGRKGHYRELFEEIAKDGFTKVRVDGEIREIEDGMKVDRYKIHDIEIVVDRLVVNPEGRSRLTDSLEIALKFGEGVVIIEADGNDMLMSQKNACPTCGTSYEELAPNSFSFNSPYGACKSCDGLGEKRDFDIDLIIPDIMKSLNEEGVVPLGKPRRTWWWAQVKAVADAYDFDFDTPLCDLSEEAMETLLHGSGKEKYDISYTHPDGRVSRYHHTISGVIPSLDQYYENTTSNSIREWAESFMTTHACTTCAGGRLNEQSLSVLIDDRSIADIVSLSIDKALEEFASLNLTARQQEIGTQIIKEINARLEFLNIVGLNYLTLDRSARSLSGGEAQRIRLATQIGTQLTGVLYVLDEPSIGLHQRDNTKLIHSLKQLRDLGNSVIVVEHDKEMIESADHIVDLGPGAGEYGGAVVAEGGLDAIRKNGKPKKAKKNGSATQTQAEQILHDFGQNGSLTAMHLRGEREIPTPAERRSGNGKMLSVIGATGHNLKDVRLDIPLGTFTCVTGVSGSGKSSLINQTLYPILSKHFYKSLMQTLPFKSIEGIEHIDKVIDIDQAPIGRTPRSNPATYTGLFTYIRDLFTSLPEAKIRGYSAGRFSFNVEGGRCEACKGDGLKKIEMNFLPDVYVQCEVCKGKRYNRETLEVKYHHKSISDVLEMSVEEAREFFSEIPRIKRKIDTLYDVGLGYIRLGQQATTLSGGEAQRVKLATELSKVGTGNTLYILDEPTTGLHFEDIRMLLDVLGKLVDKGNTVIVIEHNLDVIKTADWIIDIGPEGGDAGGEIVGEGTPEDVIKMKTSYTGQYLKKEL
ncbi:MAG: excinuclease ABC subunit A [Ectothiorhodospiraceae bacterium]|nr:excinuclease ABC subunit A [Ectothiorhodospiraceae bacterium]